MEGPKKEPRSRRECLLCGHLFASHIDIKCLKVMSKDPRIECDCRGFVGSIDDLEIYEKRQLNTFKEIPTPMIRVETKSTRVFDFCENAPGLSRRE